MSTLLQVQEIQTFRAATFSDAELERSFISFCQLVSPLQWKREELEGKRAELLAKTDHVHLPDFDDESAARQICGQSLLEPLRTGLGVEKWAASQSAFATLCANRLLTVAEESSVMKRLHYFKFLAFQILSSASIDEWDLARAHGLIKAAMWHRDLIVQSNMRLVVSIVKKLPVCTTRHDELVSDGIIALLRAVDRFDPSRGFRFCTYATPVIRRECFQQVHERNVDRSRYAQAAALMNLVSTRSEGEAIADRAHWLAWRKRLLGLMENLSRREQVIIRSRFCLGAHRRVKTLQRLADALKISKERVRQLERGALAKLRKAAEGLP